MERFVHQGGSIHATKEKADGGAQRDGLSLRQKSGWRSRNRTVPRG
jgi:hypothetical protein